MHRSPTVLMAQMLYSKRGGLKSQVRVEGDVQVISQGLNASAFCICYFAAPLAYTSPLRVVQGKYAEAAPHFERSLAIREKALGPEHPDVAQSLNDRAGLLLTQVRTEPSFREISTVHMCR